jgi:glutathione S-transferase
MAHKIKLYTISGSAPSLTARLMLDHKGLEHRDAQMLAGPHAFGLLARGFEMMTVPALRIDGRRVQGTRELSRALDELQPRPPLFPPDPERHRAVVDAERWGEQLQDAARRIFWCAAQRDPQAFASILRHPHAFMRPAQRITRRFVTRMASAGHRATDRAGEEDLAALPARLDQVDAWIEEGLLGGPDPNAADFQIAPAIALLRCFEDLAPFVEQRPAAGFARRLVPEDLGRIGAGALPADWLAPLLAATAAQPARA